MNEHCVRWALQWHSRNKLDGERKFFMWNGVVPYLFRTRREARAHIHQYHGDIKTRKFLRQEPHGWRLPKTVQVEVRMKAVRR